MPSPRFLCRGIAVGLASAAFCLVGVLNAGAEVSNGSHRPASDGEYRAAGKFHLHARLVVRAGRIHYLQVEQVERCSDGSRKHGGFGLRYTIPGAGLRIHPSGVFKYEFINGSHGYEIVRGRFHGNRVAGYFEASHPKNGPGRPDCGTAAPKGLPVHFVGHLTHEGQDSAGIGRR